VSFLLIASAIFVSRNKLDFAFSVSSPKTLITSGPYKFIRHPFYTSYMLAWIACFIVSSNLVSALGGMWMFYLYYSAAKFEEQAFLASPLKREYSFYKIARGMFLPKKYSSTDEENQKFEKGA